MCVYPHRSWPRIISWLLLAAVGALTATASTVVAPNSLATSDSAFGSGIFRAASYRAQAVYSSAHFPQGAVLLITELRYRPDYSLGGAFTTTVANIQFNLSTTTRAAESLSPAFAANVGANDTVVFSGPLTISSQFIGPPNGPKNFDIIVPLTTPFAYNPAAGNLLVDIRNSSGSTTASRLSGQNSTSDGASRAGGSLTASLGAADTAVEALQIVFTPTDELPTALTRGPYLQTVTTSNITVRWRTSQATNSVVSFGLTSGALNWAVTNSPFTSEHSVTLTNLAPDTKYFYGIGASGTNFASGMNYFFVAAPARQRPIRIWAMGDFGTASQPYLGLLNDPRGMRDAYYAYSSNRYTDVWLMLGDNAYNGGADDEYQANVFDVFQRMLRESAAWSAIGNHETVNSNAYLNIFNLPQNGEAGGVPSGTEYYYSFNYGNIHFVALDSEISVDAGLPTMLAWLEADLTDNTNDWLIAFWHSPPYTYGSHDSDYSPDSGGHLVKMRESVLPILESHSVDLVLCGHSHVYERSFLLDGHYGYGNTLTATMKRDGGSGREDDSGAYLKATLGTGEGEGAVYVVCGSSGWVTGPALSLPPGGYLKHPAMFLGLDRIGSMVIDVNSNRLDARFLRNNGAIDDYFTLIKGAAQEPLRIKTIKTQEDTLTLQFKTIAGQRYRVLRATRLDPSDWMPTSGVITATGATTKWSDDVSGTGNQFYQIVLIPPAP
jgi:hypothetical protein